MLTETVVVIEFTYEEVQGLGRIAASHPVIPSEYVIQDPFEEGSFDEVLEGFDFFVHNVEQMIKDCNQLVFIKRQESGSKGSVSNYIHFTTADSNKNPKNFVIELRLSNHELPKKFQEQAKKHLNKARQEVQEITRSDTLPRYRTVNMVVNNKKYASYKEAFEAVFKELKTTKGLKELNLDFLDPEYFY